MLDMKQYGIIPFGAVPSERQLAHYEMKKAFFHFGVNTFTDMEWGNGEELEKLFDPTDMNVEQWIETIKKAGFDLAIITAKHHDGFCLWPSKYTEHSVKNSPYKNGTGDVIREFTDACRKFGVKAGVYLSPWDRNAPFWGTSDYSEYYAKQLTELVTEYGEIHEVWWDGAGSAETPYDWRLWASIIRKHQPHACIFGSMGATPYVEMRWVGNENGTAGKTHYASIDAKDLEVEERTFLNAGKIGGNRYIPSECDVSIRPGWFYHAKQDAQVKSVSRLNRLWFESVGRNSIMLLNFPPDKRGLICDIDANNAILSHGYITKMLSKNYLENATITADSALCESLSAQNLVCDGEANFYAAAKNTAVIDIVLEKPAVFNVFTASEVLEAGERVTEWKLEAVNGEEVTLLSKATSIGHLRALRFPEGEYQHLRVTILAAEDKPVLRSIAAYRFEDIDDEDALAERRNLMASDLSNVEYSVDHKTATLSLGGIYPFNYISFSGRGKGKYEISIFNGSRYESLTSGDLMRGRTCVKLENPIEDSYQIQVYCETGFSSSNEFEIMIKDEP